MKFNALKIPAALLALTTALCLAGCVDGNTEDTPPEKYPDKREIVLSEDKATLDGKEIEEFDYTWHISPDEKEERYEGEEPQTDATAYIASDIWYYPELPEEGFEKEKNSGDKEWVYRYTAEGLEDYIFSTLPAKGEEFPSEMMHTPEEAAENKVLHITEAGTYVLSGKWHGQIFVDLGDRDETFADESAKVTLILNGVDVACDVAPAVFIYSAYECDNGWKDAEEHPSEVDTSDAGANIIICDGTENNVTGANVFRLYKAEYKKEGSADQPTAHKTDGAFYSCVSMNVDGEEAGTGILNITSTTYEGLDTELHLTINGGYINLYTQDDGINVNEDDVSVFTMNGGSLHIFAGLGAEGDCIDSNGYIVVNGGIIAAGTPSGSDEVLDNRCGSTVNGGKVIVVGSGQGAGPMGGPEGERPEPPEGFDPDDRPEMPDGEMADGRREPPEGEEPPEKPEDVPKY